MALPELTGRPHDNKTPVTPEPSVTLLISVLGLGSLASTISMRLIDPIVPLIAGEFRLGLTQVAMLAPVFTFCYAFGQPFIGPVADSFGKVRIIAIALAILAILQIACSVAPHFAALTWLRGMAGMAAGGIIPVAMAAVADRVVMADRQVALSRLLAAMVTGQVLGSFLSGLIGDTLGWRMAFLVAGGIAAMASVLTFILLKPRPNAQRSVMSVATVLGGYSSVLSNPMAWRVCLLVMIEGLATFSIFPFIAELLQNRGAVGSSEAGIALAIFGFGGLIYAFVAKQLVGKLGPNRMAAIGGCLLAAVLLILSLPLPRWTAPLLFGVFGLGFYLIHSTYQTQATELSTSARSSAMALFACSLFIGTALGPISVAVLRQFMPLENTLIVYATLLILLGFATGPMLNLSKDHRPR